MSIEEQIIMLLHNELLDLSIIIYAAERVREKSRNIMKNRD